jgi:hypothetical protein
MAIRSLVRPFANKAVHLRIVPRMSSVGESREVLRLVSQFGEVEHFQNLKYDRIPNPNAALVIFRDEESAKQCLQRSPLRFRLAKATSSRNSSSAKGSSEPSESDSRVFEIQSHPARANFRDQINMSHFHGGFNIDGKYAAQRDLSKRVPVLGMSDLQWRAPDNPWRWVGTQTQRHGSFRDSGPRKSLQQVYDEAETSGT